MTINLPRIVYKTLHNRIIKDCDDKLEENEQKEAQKKIIHFALEADQLHLIEEKITEIFPQRH